jgi:hypothetical protein
VSINQALLYLLKKKNGLRLVPGSGKTLMIYQALAFLPHDGGTYRQAPYEECTKEEYETMLSKMPNEIHWGKLIEHNDNVTGTQELACAVGGCEIT